MHGATSSRIRGESMTNEEAKDYIREWCPYDRHEEIIKALEQEPCEDAVSREEAHNLIIPWLNDYLLDETREALETIDYKIGDLPSVTPQPKTGHWMDRFPAKECKCSVCDFLICISNGSYIDMVGQMKYCPNCGAKMVDPQESEDRK